MKLFELFENLNQQKPIVIFGGRFQPFSSGHYDCYKLLTNKFGKDHVFIATSNKTNYESALGSISPLNFKEKQSFISSVYKIDKDKIVETNNPLFLPKEITQLNGLDKTYIQATGIKNVNRYESNKKFIQYDINGDNNLTALDNKFYYIAIPPQSKGVSATSIRNELLNQKTDTDIKQTFTKIFKTYNEEQCNILMNLLKKVKA